MFGWVESMLAVSELVSVHIKLVCASKCFLEKCLGENYLKTELNRALSSALSNG